MIGSCELVAVVTFQRERVLPGVAVFSQYIPTCHVYSLIKKTGDIHARTWREQKFSVPLWNVMPWGHLATKVFRGESKNQGSFNKKKFH